MELCGMLYMLIGLVGMAMGVDTGVNVNEGVGRFENGAGRRRREYQVDVCVRREPFVCRARPLFCLWVVLTIQVNEGWCGGGISGVYLVVEPWPVFIVFDISRVYMVSITWHTKNTPPKQPIWHMYLVVPCAHGI